MVQLLITPAATSSVYNALSLGGIIVGILGGSFGFITYFSNTSKRIRNSDARIKETAAWDASITLLLKWKEEAEKEIIGLKNQVDALIQEGNNKNKLVDMLTSIIESAFSCKYNQENTDNCPVCIKKRAKDLENK
jgi:predicted PurR-regulated permease PerM